MAFLAAFYTLGLASIVALLALGRLCLLALGHGHASAIPYIKRCAVAAVPLLIGFIIFVFGFLHDPLWPDQDETAGRRAARLAARGFADRFYVAAAVFSAGGLLWFSRATLATPGQDAQPGGGGAGPVRRPGTRVA